MNAQELRDLTVFAVEYNTEYAMKMITPALKVAASEGKMTITLEYPKGCSHSLFRSYLVGKGYSVKDQPSHRNELVVK